MRRFALLLLPMFCFHAPAMAQMFGPGYAPCGEQQSTSGSVDCVAAKTKVWDRRLNASYKALAARSDPAQREPLKAAQRLWIQYRDANCRFYALGEGTIHQIEAVECERAMTRQRACEMETANLGEGQPAADCK